jgi:hypothetical protein
MSPKNKAEELVNTFYSIEEPNQGCLFNKNMAKQCALIAVGEIEDALYNYGGKSMELQNMDATFRYWQNVNKEIEKL